MAAVTQVRVGGKLVSATDVFRIEIHVHPMEQDEDAPLGLYELTDVTGKRLVAYETMEAALLRVAEQAKPSKDPRQWVENQVARLIGHRRLYVITSTGEAYT